MTDQSVITLGKLSSYTLLGRFHMLSEGHCRVIIEGEHVASLQSSSTE